MPKAGAPQRRPRLKEMLVVSSTITRKTQRTTRERREDEFAAEVVDYLEGLDRRRIAAFRLDYLDHDTGLRDPWLAA